MNNKQIVRDLLDTLPDNASIEEIVEGIRFLAGIHEGLAELDRGEFVTLEEMRKSVRLWASDPGKS